MNAPFRVPGNTLCGAVLDQLRDDAAVQAVLGQPPRLFDDETCCAAYPYARLERHESIPIETSEIRTVEHKITVASYARFGGLAEAKMVLSCVSEAVTRLNLELEDQNMVLAHVVYCDVMRAPDQRTFRGIIRIRIIMESA